MTRLRMWVLGEWVCEGGGEGWLAGRQGMKGKNGVLKMWKNIDKIVLGIWGRKSRFWR